MSRPYVPLFAAVRHSTKIADLSDHAARVLYFMLLPQCDAWGRMARDPRVVDVETWPMLRAGPDETERCLQELERAGLIESHEANGTRWIQVPDWEDKSGSIGRRDNRPKSRWPESTGSSRSGPVGGGRSRSETVGTGRSQSEAVGAGRDRSEPVGASRLRARGEGDGDGERERDREGDGEPDSAFSAEPVVENPGRARQHVPSQAENVWQASWTACRAAGEPYELTRADCVALNRLASKHGLERLRSKADALLSDLETFTFANASPTLLVKRWSNLGQPRLRRMTQAELNVQATASVADQIDAIEAAAKARRAP